MAEDWSTDQLSTDDFLGGRLKITQPIQGYRAGVDPVILAASVDAVAGDSVLELGCGVGVASLCLGCRIQGLALTGIELQDEYARLARQNAATNNHEMTVVSGDLAQMPDDLRQEQFNHVIANPPYFDRRASIAAQDSGREVALGEGTPLAEWVNVAARRTAPKGTVTFIHRAERLPDLLSAAMVSLGSLQILPLIPRPGRAARLVLLRGRKGGRAEFRLHHGWVLHEGEKHSGDRESYTQATAKVLRDGAALSFGAKC